MPDASGNPPDTDNSKYHHHAWGVTTLEDFDQENVTAVCGYVKKPHPNPMQLPCCPDCSRLIKSTCPSEQWT